MDDDLISMLGMDGVSGFAGAEIDNGLLGRDTSNYQCVQRLSRELESVSGDPIIMNPSFTLAFHRASNPELETFKEIAYLMSSIATELRNVANLPVQRQEELRGFCVDLSKQLMHFNPSGTHYLAA